MQSLQIAAEFCDSTPQTNDDAEAPAERSIAPCRRWTARALDSAVCTLCLLILSPAIVAVWIAIRRSTHGPTLQPANAARDTDGASDSGPTTSVQPVMIVLKPDRLRHAAFESSNAIRPSPSNVAHAAV